MKTSKTFIDPMIPEMCKAQKRHSLFDLSKINTLLHKYSSYCCPFCSLLPEIIKYNEANNTLKLKCDKHGEKTMDIREYLERMSKYEYLIDFKSINKCKLHNENYIIYCKTCNENLCSKCEKENNTHNEHIKYKIESIHPNNNEILLIKNKINIYLQEKAELTEKIKILEDKITFYDTLINTFETQKENYLLNMNIKHLIYGEKVNLSEIVNDFDKNANQSNGQINQEKFDDFIKNNFLTATKNKGQLNLLNKKLTDETLTKLITEMDNESIFRILRFNKQLNTNQKEANLLSLKNINVLNLRGNKISNLKFISGKAMPVLQILSLNDNEINSIDLLNTVNCPQIKELYLAKNQIKDIEVLSNVKFKKLQILWLGNNCIENIDVFERVCFPQLQKLGLSKNNIKDISVFNKVKFPQLFEMYINDNDFDREESEVNEIIEKLNEKIKEFYY